MNEPAETSSGPISASVAETFGPETEPTIETPPEPTSPEPAPQPEPRPEPTLTQDQIRESVRAGLREAQPQQPEAPKQYTEEELDKLFNVWKPDDTFVQRVLAGGEDGLKAIIELRDGLSRQFGTLLQYQLELARRDLVGQMDPALRFVADAAATRDREEFFAQNEDLRQHELLTQTVFNALKAEGYQAPDKPTAYKTLADRTRALIPTSSNGSGTAPSGGSRTKTSPTDKRPASLSSGSQAGGGGGSAPQAPFPGAEVFL